MAANPYPLWEPCSRVPPNGRIMNSPSSGTGPSSALESPSASDIQFGSRFAPNLIASRTLFPAMALVATSKRKGASFLAGAAIGVFAATHQIWIAALSLTLAGFAVASLGVSTQTLIQAGVPDAMRGRVLSIWGLLLRGVPALGALLMGWLSDFFGLQPPVLGAVALYFAVMLWLNRRRVAIAGLEAGPSTGGTQPER